MSELPFLSVIVPCFNEEAFVARCLDSILGQDYPTNRMELLVVDGISTDRTPSIVQHYAASDARVRVLQNTKKVAPAAQNIGITQSRGSVLAVLDAHATYEADYLSGCVECLISGEGDVVGGTMVTAPQRDTTLGNAIILALTHRFGVGSSTFRLGAAVPTRVNSVFASCYKREVFDKVGGFNESIPFSYDMELAARVRQAGFTTLLYPQVKSHYYARSGYLQFCSHNFRNGAWVILPRQFTSMPLSFRHLIPCFFVTILMLLLLLVPISGAALSLLIMIVGVYSLASVVAAAGIAWRRRQPVYLAVMPVVFLTLHVTYGVGTVYGFGRFARERLRSRGVRGQGATGTAVR